MKNIELQKKTKEIVLNKLKTKEKAAEFILNIEMLETSRYKKTDVPKVGIKEIIGSEYSELLSAISANTVNENNVSENEKDTRILGKIPSSELLNKIKDWLKSIEIVQMTFSFLPSEKFVGRIYNWFIENIDYEVLIDFKKDNLIRGGLKIIYKGLYLDLSLEKRLGTYFSNNKDAILSKF